MTLSDASGFLSGYGGAMDRQQAHRLLDQLGAAQFDAVVRCGDCRVFFDPKDETTIEITGVRNRREAYR